MIRQLVGFAGTLPEWLRPPFWGAVIVLALVATRLLVLLPFGILGPGTHLTEILLTLPVAAAAGATGGLAWSLIGRKLADWAYVGPFLAGIVAVGGYQWPLLFALQFMKPGYLTLDGPGVVIGISLNLILGSVFGWFAFRRD